KIFEGGTSGGGVPVGGGEEGWFGGGKPAATASAAESNDRQQCLGWTSDVSRRRGHVLRRAHRCLYRFSCRQRHLAAAVSAATAGRCDRGEYADLDCQRGNDALELESRAGQRSQEVRSLPRLHRRVGGHLSTDTGFRMAPIDPFRTYGFQQRVRRFVLHADWLSRAARVWRADLASGGAHAG